MHDVAVSMSKVVTAALWVLSLLLLLAAWIVGLTYGIHTVSVLLGFTAVIVAAMAGVSQVRLYTLRVCGIMRATAGLVPADAELHRLR